MGRKNWRIVSWRRVLILAFLLVTIAAAGESQDTNRRSGVSPAVVAKSSSPLPGTFFSMNWNHFIPSATWPSVPFGGIRLWDNYASWQDIEKANGTYNWNNLDKWLAAADASHTDVLYAFGRTPDLGLAQTKRALWVWNGLCRPAVRRASPATTYGKHS